MSCLATAAVLALLCATVSTDYSADYSAANLLAVKDNLDTTVLLDFELNDSPARGAPCKNYRDCDGLDDVNCELDKVENKKFCKCGNDSMWYSPELRRCLAPCLSDADCGKSDNVHCTLYPERRSSFCKCDSESMWYGSKAGACAECDCGVNGNCSFQPGPKKQCSCNKGYFQKNGTCQVCDCGENGMCVFNNKGERMCICNDGYRLKSEDGNCEECYCGNNSVCSFEKGKKVCLCGGREEQFEGKCKVCDCGYLARDCKFNSTGGEVCEECGLSSAMKHGKCAECDCGFPSFRCYFEGDTKRCECVTRYKEENGRCTEIPDPPVLRIIGIVLGVLGGVTIVGVVIFYIYRKNRSRARYTH